MPAPMMPDQVRCDVRHAACLTDGGLVLGTWVCRHHLGSLAHIQTAVARYAARQTAQAPRRAGEGG